ncbi:MAG: hypothetical protein WC003_07275 [Terrimicrobiaceae bacterium]
MNNKANGINNPSTDFLIAKNGMCFVNAVFGRYIDTEFSVK